MAESDLAAQLQEAALRGTQRFSGLIAESRTCWERLRADPVFQTANPDPAARQTAIRSLCLDRAFIPSRLRNPRLRRRLAEEKRLRGPGGLRRWLREEILPAAMTHALGGIATPRTVRIGSGRGSYYLRDCDTGAVEPVEPQDLTRPLYGRWLRQVTLGYAARLLLDHNLDPALPVYSHPPDLRVFVRLAHQMSTRDLAVLGLRNQGMTYARIAARLGIAPASARQVFSRLARKARSKTP